MNSLAKLGLWGLLAGGTASALYADPVGGWLSPNGVSAGVGTTSAGAAVPGTLVTLPLAEIQLRVRHFHDQTRVDLRHIQHLQQVARQAKDVIKLNCVNDKLVQVKPQLNIADAGEAELEAAGEANRMAAFDTVTQAAENIRQLREEADRCIGEPIGTGDSSNTFTGPLVPDDPTKGVNTPVIEPPSYASPFN
jgi:hypothetical protein